MKRVVILVVLILILAGAGGAGWWFFLREDPDEDSVAAATAELESGGPNSERSYELKPFVLPILREGQVIEHLTLLLRVEFTSPELEDDIKAILPRLRDSLFKELHGVLAFRHINEQKEIMPIVRERLLKAGNDVFGPGRIKAVLVQGMSRRAPGEG